MTLWKQTYCKLIAFYWFTFGIAKGCIQSLRCDLLFLSWPKTHQKYETYMTDVDEKIWKYLQDIWKPRKLQPSNPFKSMDPQEIQNTQFPSISKRSPSDLQTISKHPTGLSGRPGTVFPATFPTWRSTLEGLGLLGLGLKTWHPGSQHGTENWPWPHLIGEVWVPYSPSTWSWERQAKANMNVLSSGGRSMYLPNNWGSCMLSCIAAVVNCCDFGWRRSIVFK